MSHRLVHGNGPGGHDGSGQSRKAWGSLLAGLVPEREHAKPRRGVTMILDRCQGLVATADLLEMAGDYVDQVKLSFGTSALLSEAFIRRKNELLRAYDIDVYPGGTLAEAMLVQGVYPQFLARARVLGFTAIEISDGTITLSPQARADAIKRARDADLKVFSEVGKKAPALALPVAQLCEQIAADLALGVEKVIVEARESGTGIGIYDAGGTVRQEMLATILDALGDHADDVIWEAPRQSQQAQLIQRCGANVNLGNVRPRDVLGLEESLNIWTRTRSWSRGRRSAAPRVSRSSPCWPMGRPSSRPTGFGSRSNSAAWTQRSAH